MTRTSRRRVDNERRGLSARSLGCPANKPQPITGFMVQVVMPIGEPKTYQAVRSFLERQKLDFTESQEQYCDMFTVRAGQHVAHVSVFNSAKIVTGGKDSPVKALLDQMKGAIEAGEAAPGQILPFEIDKFPQTIQQRVPDCDPVIVRFIEEAILSVRANALLGAAFMLGAASEKAINMLVYTYAESITDAKNKERFLSRVNGRMISKKFEEFTASYKGCQNKPTDPVLAQDLEVIIGGMFQFCRVTRNEIGHPQIVPDLDRGIILVNFRHFVTYIERIYALAKHFKEKGVLV